MKKILLISGRMRSGKNQFADYLAEECVKAGLKVSQDLFASNLKDWSSHDFKLLASTLKSLGDAMKNEVVGLRANRSTYGIPDDGVHNNLIKLIDQLTLSKDNFYENKTNISRSLLQIYGTEIFRQRVDDLYWIKLTQKRIKASESDVIIITDVRFPNEIDFIANCDDYETYSIRINRLMDRNSRENEHSSETSLDKYEQFSYTIENNLTLADLKICAKTLLDDLLELECQQV